MIRAQMDPSSLSSFKKRAIQFAQRKNFTCEADDFASYALLKHVEGTHQTLSQLWIDYLRENYGDLRTKTRQSQDRLQTQKITSKSNLLDSHRSDDNIDFGFILRFLSDHGEWFSQRDRALLVLKYEWGAKQVEIAHIFGVTEAYVSQSFEEIESRIRHMISAQLDGVDK